jgi:hypothetical protein
LFLGFSLCHAHKRKLGCMSIVIRSQLLVRDSQLSMRLNLFATPLIKRTSIK